MLLSPTITSYQRGHLIEYNLLTKQWVYSDDKSSIEKERPCIRCGELPTKEGYDTCLGHIPGLKSACCGHGVEAPYLIVV